MFHFATAIISRRLKSGSIMEALVSPTDPATPPAEQGMGCEG